MSAIAYIEDHPAVIFIVGSCHLLAAEILPAFEIPVLVMQLFQIGAWSVTITIGSITIYGFFKKKFKKK